jgi:hypothetical protein
MLNPARSSQGGGDLDQPIQIGLIGAPGSGASGLVWSSIIASGRRMPADRWYLDHVGGADKGELLSYLNPPHANQTQGRAGRYDKRASAEFSPMITQFAIFEDLAKGGMPSPRRADVIEIFDTTSGRPTREQDEAGWFSHACDHAPHVVLCHPMDHADDGQPLHDKTAEYEKIFARLLRRCGRNAKKNGLTQLQSVVVAFTKYDLAFLGTPRQASRQASSPWVAREYLLRELRRVEPLRNGLRGLTEAGRVRVLGAPVSSFGFLPSDGRPNYDRWLVSDLWPPGAALMTRPDIYCRALEAMYGGPSYTADEEVNWLLKHWQPFLTWLPFVACISEDDHELLFPMENLLDAATPRKAWSA